MRVTSHLLPPVLLLSLLSPSRVDGKLQTVFVDDASGDSLTKALPAFLPSEAGFSQGPLCQGCGDAWCQGCSIQPNPSKAYGGTWMVATHFENDPVAKYITFDFVGTEVAIFCIVPNLPSSSNIVSRYSLDFRIDSELPPNRQTIFDHVSDSSGTYQYNVSVFRQTGLTQEKHTMMVRAVRPDVDAVLLFDYATYVFDDKITETSSSTITSDPLTPITIPPAPVSSTLTQTHVSTTIPRTTSSTPPSSPSPSLDSPVPIHHTSSVITSASPVLTALSTVPSSPRENTPSTETNDQHDSSSGPDRRKHLAVILGSVFGALLAVLLGAFLVYRLRRRGPAGSRQSPDHNTVRPFSLRNPSIPKSREKLFLNQDYSRSTLPSETEEGPPRYSQRSFQLN